MAKSWLSSEVKFLKNNTHLNIPELSNELGRSKPSVSSMCQRMGITVAYRNKIDVRSIDGMSADKVITLLDIANVRTIKTRNGVVDCVTTGITSIESALINSASSMCINRAMNKIIYVIH